jgi:hypothetical protein
VSREARREKKQRTLERRQASSEHRESGSEDSTSDDDQTDDDRDGTEELNSAVAKRGKGKERSQGQRIRDMYKVFDGTALVALGNSCCCVFVPSDLCVFRVALSGARC